MQLRALAPPVVAAAALALLAAPAGAATRQIYEGTLDATLALHTSESSGGRPPTRRLDVQLRLRTTFARLEFVEGVFVRQQTGSRTSVSGVELHDVFVNDDETIDCRATSVTVRGAPFANPLHAFDRTVPPATIDVMAPPLLDFGRVGCSEGFETVAFGAAMDYLDPLPSSHFHARVVVPRAQLGDHDIVLPFTGASNALAKCPEVRVQPNLESCSTLWRGVLRLQRLYPLYDEDDEDLLVPLAPLRRARVDRRASRADVAVRCPRGCRATIRIFLPPRRGRGRIERGLAAPRALASAAAPLAARVVTLPAGRAERVVSVPIPSARRAALRAAGRALVDVTLDPPRGRSVRRRAEVAVGG